MVASTQQMPTSEISGSPRSGRAQGPATSRRVNVLVVHEQPGQRRMLCDILEGPDYHPIGAASGAEALRLLLENDFGVILLAVSMDEMDGFELASIIRQRERMTKVPILFLAGADTDESLVVRGYRAGAVDYLVDPVLPEIVRAKVRVFAELFRQKQRIEEQTARLLEAEGRERELLLVELRLASERRFRALADAMPQIIW